MTQLVEVKGGSQPPSLLFLLFFVALGWDLLFVINPLIYEGIITGDVQFSIFGLDQWFIHVFFGISYDASFHAYAVFVTFLLAVYFLTFVIGFLIPLWTTRPIFRELLTKREVTYSDLKFAAVEVLDLFPLLFFMWLGFDRILAYLTQYPWPLPSVLSTSSSFIATFVMAGFLTGNSVSKSMFALRVHLECRRDHLEVRTIWYKKLDAQGRLSRGRLFKWILVPAAKTKRKGA